MESNAQIFVSELSKAAKLARINSVDTLTIKLELGTDGITITCKIWHKLHQELLQLKKFVSYHDVAYSHGQVLQEALKLSVRSFGRKFIYEDKNEK